MMKRLAVWAAVITMCVIVAQPLTAQDPYRIKGSAHDFTAALLLDDDTLTTTGDTIPNAFYFWPSYAGYGICSSCHTAHNAYVTDAPLWSHDTTTATFTLYSSSTMDATVGQPSGVSKACLSCHDGTVAVNAVHGSTVTNSATGGPVSGAVSLIAGDAGYIGTDLSNDHPISIAYGLDASLRSVADVATGGLRLYGTAGNETVECGSCHDPHRGQPAHYFLRAYTGYQTNCLVCHDK